MNVLLLFPFLSQVSAANTAAALEEVQEFTKSDPYGLLMAALGMGIVFSVLYLLYIIFSNTPVLYTPGFRDKLKSVFSKKHRHVVEDPINKNNPDQVADLTGEVNAAIAAAIHLYRSELHDYEDTVLTIKKVSRTYSPWSSKIYGLRQFKH